MVFGFTEEDITSLIESKKHVSDLERIDLPGVKLYVIYACTPDEAMALLKDIPAGNMSIVLNNHSIAGMREDDSVFRFNFAGIIVDILYGKDEEAIFKMIKEFVTPRTKIVTKRDPEQYYASPSEN